MNDFTQAGGSIGAGQNAGDIMAVQQAAQRRHTRDRALDFALRARNGTPINTAQLLTDAAAIMAWLSNDGQTTN